MMVVLRGYMWPQGRKEDQQLLSSATLTCLGVARADDPALGIQKGERAYRFRIFRDVAFGGPDEAADLRTCPRPWREGFIRGHRPGHRGLWDLLGGALRGALGARLTPYVPFNEPTKYEVPSSDEECAYIVAWLYRRADQEADAARATTLRWFAGYLSTG